MGDSELLDEAFSQLQTAHQTTWQPKESKRFVLSVEELICMTTFKFHDPQPAFSCLKILTAIYERTQGFLTPFYELEYNVKTPEETELLKAECKK